MSKKKGKIIIISGPTGSGESSVTHGVFKKLKNTRRIITATNRPPRGKEKNGRDYFFFTTQKFKEKIKNKELSEYTYIKNRNHYYGTIKSWVEQNLNQGAILIGNLDIIGAKFYKKNYNAITIFIKPENFSNIKKRLLQREPNMDLKELKKRLANAKKELKDAKKYDHQVINYQNKLSQTITKVLKIIKENNL